MSELEVGQKVRVNVGHIEVGFVEKDYRRFYLTEEMKKLNGKTFTISCHNRLGSNEFYDLEGASFVWLQEWLSPVNEVTEGSVVEFNGNKYRIEARFAKEGDLMYLINEIDLHDTGDIMKCTNISSAGYPVYGTETHQYLWHLEYYTMKLIEDYVIHEGKTYKKVKRLPNIGELMLVVDSRDKNGRYQNDDILTCVTYLEILDEKLPKFSNDYGHFLYDIEYVTLDLVEEIEKDTESTETSEPQQDIIKLLSDIKAELAEIKAEIKKNNQSQAKENTTVMIMPEIKVKRKLTRQEVIEKAKDDFIRLSHGYYISVSDLRKTKSVVVFLSKYTYTLSRKDYAGVAKCNKDDVFNIHIGKAIAIHRALDLEIPEYLLDVEQPTESDIKEGFVIKSKYRDVYYQVVDESTMTIVLDVDKSSRSMKGETAYANSYEWATIVDDSCDEKWLKYL